MGFQVYYTEGGISKSTALYRRMLEQAEANPNKKYIIMVPEQFTLQTQRDLARLSTRGGMLNIDVLSFQRLAYRVFEENGGSRQPVLEDTGKSMIVRKVLMDRADELLMYGKNAGKPGFVDEMKSIIAEFYQYSVDDEILDKMEALASDKPLMRLKLHDIRLIYDGFKEFLRGKYMTNEEILDRLGDMIDSAEYVKGAVFLLDGYTGFTPAQYKVIDGLMRSAESVSVLLTMDGRDMGKKLFEHDLFYLSYSTARKLEAAAVKNHIDFFEEYFEAEDEENLKSAALKHLEHNLFRYPYEKFETENETEDVVLMRSKDRNEEIMLTICEIKRLVREGCKYGDIAVISGDMQNYADALRIELDRAGMPYFVDEPSTIMMNPIVQILRALFETAQNDFSYESVFKLLRCGIILDTVETDELENYVIALGIHGKSRWKKDWSQAYKTHCMPDIWKINSLREKVISTVLPTAEVLCSKTANVRAKLTALYEFLVSADAVKLLDGSRTAKSTHLSERLKKERENEQVLRLIVDVFERIEVLLGDDILSAEELCGVLDTGIRETRLRTLPQTSDSLLIGDMERTRMRGIKVMFFLGMNDGVVPRSKTQSGVLTDYDRELLCEKGVELAPTSRQNAYLAEFYLYLNFTKPLSKLYLSYYHISQDGKAARPSYLVDRVCRLYSSMRRISVQTLMEASRQSLYDVLLGTDRGFASLVRAARDGAGENEEIFGALYELFSREEKERMEQMKHALGGRGMNEQLDELHARMLYGSVLTGSVTRLEKYAACAFSHFLRYGLQLEERAVYEFKPLDLGILYHKSIELFGQYLRDKNIGWHNLGKETKAGFISRAVEEAAAGYGNNILKSSMRSEYILTRLTRVVERTVDVLEAQINKGGFEPAYYEEAFFHAGKYMNLRGQIDRMDTVQRGDKLYLRVIDYKSGNSEFDLERLYHGLSVQLGVYLSAGMEIVKEKHEGEVVPAGIYYYNIDDPIVEKSENYEAQIMRALRLKGLSSNDPDALVLTDSGFERNDGDDKKLADGIKSEVVDVERLKSGGFSKASKIADPERMKALGEFVDEKLHEEGEAVMKGDAKINPYRLSGSTACDYCGYRAVCGFDRSCGGTYREIKHKSNDEIWREICQEQDGQTNSKA